MKNPRFFEQSHSAGADFKVVGERFGGKTLYQADSNYVGGWKYVWSSLTWVGVYLKMWKLSKPEKEKNAYIGKTSYFRKKV